MPSDDEPDDEDEELRLNELEMGRFELVPLVEAWLAHHTAEDQKKMTKALHLLATAWRQARSAQEREAAAQVDIRREDLLAYFLVKGDVLSPEALAKIEAASETTVVRSWLMRAYRAETVTEIFRG